MTKAEELLDTLPEEGADAIERTEAADSYLIIDPATRTMSNKVGDENVVMQFDHDSESIIFELPRYVNGNDMLLCNSVVVHWNNIEEGTKRENASVSDIYDLRINPEDGSTVICSWKISRQAVQYAGILSILVQYKRVESGVTTYEWHTDAYSNIIVKPGRNNSVMAISEYTDILEQWRERIFGSKDSVLADISAACEEQKSAIQSKGEEVLATIPEDYTATYNMANKALRTRAPAIEVTTEGETIVAEDCSDDYLRNLRVFGKTTQIKTTGRQLAHNTATMMTTNGITFITNDDGSITVRGTASGGSAYYLFDFRNDIPVKETSLIASITGDKVSMVVGYFTSQDTFINEIVAVDSTISKTFMYPAEATATRSFLSVNEGVTIDTTVYPLIRLASDNIDTYEPYSGGVASPSIEFPQPLKSADSPSVALMGQNLAYFGDALSTPKTVSGITISLLPDGRIITTGTPTVTGAITTVHAKALTGDAIIVGARYRSEECSMQVAWANGNTTWVRDVIATEDVTSINAYIQPHSEYVTNGATVKPIMWIEDLKPDSFVQGVKTQSIRVPYILRAIPVESGGNYTDSNGQQWIADEIDFERGVYIQRVKEFVFDGVGFDIRKHQENEDQWLYCVYSLDIDTSVAGRGLSSALPYRKANDMNVAGGCIKECAGYDASNSYEVLYLNLGYLMTENTVEALRAALAENPMTFVLALKTPIETPLTEEDILNFANLRSNKTYTSVFNDENAHLELTYNADTKTYIKNLIRDTLSNL